MLLPHNSEMAPAFRGGRRKSCCNPRLKRSKKKSVSQQLTDNIDIGSSSKQLAMPDLEEKNAIDIVTVSGYSTPKGKKSQIPEDLSCPPAPKKRRIAAVHRPENAPSISFFTSPDLELFFLYALQEISL